MELTKQNIVQLLNTDNVHVIGRALVALNERQTADEQASKNTKYHNGQGFRPCHAHMGTSMAEFYTKCGYLTAKQQAYWQKPSGKTKSSRIGIYAGQLLKVALAKQAEKQLELQIED